MKHSRVIALILCICLSLTPVLSSMAEEVEIADVISSEISPESIQLIQTEETVTETVVEPNEIAEDSNEVLSESVMPEIEKEPLSEKDIETESNGTQATNDSDIVPASDEDADVPDPVDDASPSIIETDAESSETDLEQDNFETESPALSEDASDDIAESTITDYPESPADEAVLDGTEDDELPPVSDTAPAPEEAGIFTKGYAKVLQKSDVFEDQFTSKVIGTLQSGLVEVTDRVQLADFVDLFAVRFISDGEMIKGFVSVIDLQPCGEDEVIEWKASGRQVEFIKAYENAAEKTKDASANNKLTIVSEESMVPAESEVTSESIASIYFDSESEEELSSDPETELLVEDEEFVEIASIEDDEFILAEEDEENLVEAAIVIPDSKTLTPGADFAYDQLSQYPSARNWTLSLENAGRLTVYANPQDSKTITVYIWNEGIDTCYRTASGSSPFVMDDIWLDAGTYNVVVDGASQDVVYSIRAVFNPASDAITGYKSYDNPYSLASSTTYTRGVFTEQDHVDYYLFTASEASQIVMMTRVYEPGVTITLMTASDMAHSYTWSLAAGSEANPNVQEHDYWIEAGRYFIKVESTGNTGLYDIYAYTTSAGAVDEESNDGRGIATEIALDTEYRGMLSMTDSVDYYVITMPHTSNVGISMRESTNGISAKLYSKNMDLLLADLSSPAGSGSSISKPVETYSELRLEAGEIYFLVVEQNSGKGLYSFTFKSKLTVESVTVTPESGVFDSYFTATAVVSGGTPVAGNYRLYKKQGDGTYVEYYNEPSVSPTWTLFAQGTTAAQRATWEGTWKIAYMAYDGFNWTWWDSNDFTIGTTTHITSVSMASTTQFAKYTFGVSVKTEGITPTLFVYDVVDSNNSLLMDKRVITTSPIAIMTVDAVGKYKIMVSVTNGYTWDVAYSTDFIVVSAVQLNGVSLTASGSTLTAVLDVSRDDPVYTQYQVYCDGALIHTETVANGRTYQYATQSAGTYSVSATVYNGDSWSSGTSSNTVAIAPQFEVYSMHPDVYTALRGTNVTYTAQVTGTIAKATFYLNYVSGGVSKTVDTWEGKSASHTFTLTDPGYYAVYAIFSDGNTEKHVASDFVSVQLAGSKVESVTLDQYTAGVGKNIRATLVTSGDPTIYVRWVVQTTTGTIIRDWTGNNHSYIFNVPAKGAYIVTAIVAGYPGDGDFGSSDVLVIVE